MNASIDFWLDELDTQVMELSPEELRAIRAGSPDARSRRPAGSGETTARASSAQTAGGATGGPTWTCLASSARA